MSTLNNGDDKRRKLLEEILRNKAFVDASNFANTANLNPYQSPTPFGGYTYAPSLTPDEEDETSYVLFCGFSGILANKYIVMKPGVPYSEVERSVILFGEKIPVKVLDKKQFEVVHQNLPQTIKLQEIDFDGALAIIRQSENGNTEQIEVVAYEDVEEDEFTENCTDECIPGRHKCK